MKHSFFLLLASLILWTLSLSALSAQEVVIVDPGELYSSYVLRDNPTAVASLKAKGFSSDELEEIYALAQESGWPKGLSSLDLRLEARDLITQYKGVLMATFDGKTLVSISIEDNRHLPNNMQPDPVFYLVISNQGISTDGSPAYNRWPAYITDSGELYSTYGIADKEEDMELLRESLPEALVEDIALYSEETNWPETMSTLDGRNANRPLIAEYTVYALAEIDGAWVLEVPVQENEEMPEGMAPDRTFYMIIGSSGVDVDQSQAFSRTFHQDEEYEEEPYAYDEEGEIEEELDYSQFEGFEEQVVAIYDAGADDYVAIAGDEIEQEEGSLALMNEFVCLIQMEDALSTEVYESLIGGNISVVADYGTFENEKEALATYKALVEKVKSVKMPYCSLIMNEIENEVLTTTYFLPFDLAGEMDEALKDNLLEVKLIKSFNITPAFKMVDTWLVSVVFSKQEE